MESWPIGYNWKPLKTVLTKDVKRKFNFKYDENTLDSSQCSFKILFPK